MPVRSRFVCFSLLILLLFVFVLPSHVYTKNKERCDRPGKAFLNRKLNHSHECQELCQSEDKCESWVFVSHWNNCALKEARIQPRNVRFISQKRGEDLKVDHDLTAKDMKNLPHTTDAQACMEACSKDEKCSGMTYIEGYRDCWLKTGLGRTVSKIMSCGEKSTLAPQ